MQTSLSFSLAHLPVGEREVFQTGCVCSHCGSTLVHLVLRLAIVRANRYMVDHCDFLIAYAYRPGNSRKLLEYARRREQRGFMQVTAIE